MKIRARIARVYCCRGESWWRAVRRAAARIADRGGDIVDRSPTIRVSSGVIEYITASGMGAYTLTPTEFTFEGSRSSFRAGTPFIRAELALSHDRSRVEWCFVYVFRGAALAAVIAATDVQWASSRPEDFLAAVALRRSSRSLDEILIEIARYSQRSRPPRGRRFRRAWRRARRFAPVAQQVLEGACSQRLAIYELLADEMATSIARERASARAAEQYELECAQRKRKSQLFLCRVRRARQLKWESAALRVAWRRVRYGNYYDKPLIEHSPEGAAELIAAALGCHPRTAVEIVNQYRNDSEGPPRFGAARIYRMARTALTVSGLLIGWRTWLVDRDGVLISPLRGTVWDTAELVAEGPLAPGDVRGQCGIHAAWSPRRGDHILVEGWVVLGRVEGTGLYAAGPEGWRVERVRISRLWVDPQRAIAAGHDPDALRHALRQRYRVPTGIRRFRSSTL